MGIDSLKCFCLFLCFWQPCYQTLDLSFYFIHYPVPSQWELTTQSNSIHEDKGLRSLTKVQAQFKLKTVFQGVQSSCGYCLKTFFCVTYPGKGWGKQGRMRVWTSFSTIAVTFSTISGPFQLSQCQGNESLRHLSWYHFRFLGFTLRHQCCCSLSVHPCPLWLLNLLWYCRF